MKMIIKKYDVVIFGGGPAGISAAYTAASLGFKTLLIEKNNYLGGQITGGLVIPMMKSSSDDINTEFYKKLLEYAKKFNAQITYSDGNEGWFNPTLLKIIFEKMLKDVKVDIVFEAELLNKKINRNSKIINSVKIKSKILSLHIYSKYFIDATGDSNFCKFLNCNFIDDENKVQPSSLRFIISNIDLEKFSTQILSADMDRNVTTATKINEQIHLSTAYTFDSNKNWGLAPFFKKALEAGDLKYQDSSYFQVFTIAGMSNSLAFNCPRLKDADDLDTFSYSNALIEARAAIYRLYNFMKKYFNGFEHSFISQIADMTGTRVSERPKTKYIYKLSDITDSKTFDNTILTADYPVDIHSNKKDSSTLKIVKKYFLPVESLISEDFNNLFVCGRNLGAEFEAQGALRIQKSCMSMGEGLIKFLHKSTNNKC